LLIVLFDVGEFGQPVADVGDLGLQLRIRLVPEGEELRDIGAPPSPGRNRFVQLPEPFEDQRLCSTSNDWRLKYGVERYFSNQ
jgi:hypothetical protein